MREIKFRAWDGKKYYFYSLRDLLVARVTVGHGYEDFPYDVDIEHEQYTGLKDKNGVEIFEGDIVKYDSPLGSIVSIMQVVFEYGGFKQKMPKEKGADIWYSWKTVEVIGNIHENKELLEGESK